MCGICGFVGPGDRDDLQRMTDSLAHRGPDAGAVWIDAGNGVHLGHRRLAIIDIVGGAQPMVSAGERHVIVFNGEIYNFRELRAELTSRGRQFVSDHSDTEVLLQGYAEWSEQLPARLNGMWSFVIYDRLERRLFASRDRFGKKPFYYTTIGGRGFAFASELSALREHASVQSRLSISRKALKKYFGYGYIPAPHSIYDGIWKLPGGCNLTVNVDTPHAPRLTRYWRFQLEPMSRVPRDPEHEWGEQLRELLARAVKRRLVADVPVGVFLSGGIDSSAITALAAQAAPTGGLKTFTIGFEDPSFDESGPAARVAALFGTEHYVERLSMDRAQELLPEIAARLDEPMGDSSLLPTYLLARHTRRHVTVALGGDGGDELFAGYDPFRALHLAARYQRWVPRPVHRAITALAARLPVSHRNMSFDFKLKRTLRGLDHPAKFWLPIWMAPLAPAEWQDFFGEPVELEEVFSEAIDAWERLDATAHDVDRAMQFYTELYLQDDILTKVDRATMMHGLEARAPFLDIEVVDFVRRIPAEWKFRRGETKYLLKRALEPLLPRDILYRKKKGFGVPIGRWFRDGALTVDATQSMAPAFTHARLHAHRSGRADERAYLWNAWLLQQWHGSHVNTDPRDPTSGL
jgi:asparagine synthase (glutamine-hydrolysing)